MHVVSSKKPKYTKIPYVRGLCKRVDNVTIFVALKSHIVPVRHSFLCRIMGRTKSHENAINFREYLKKKNRTYKGWDEARWILLPPPFLSLSLFWLRTNREADGAAPIYDSICDHMTISWESRENGFCFAERYPKKCNVILSFPIDNYVDSNALKTNWTNCTLRVRLWAFLHQGQNIERRVPKLS